MTVIPLLVVCSLLLAACGLLMFLLSVGNRDLEHSARLSLLPLEDDESASSTHD